MAARLVLGLLPGVLGLTSAFAEDDYFAEVIAAVRRGDSRAVAALARTPREDPWLVVDRLEERDLADGARTYAGALQTATASALRAYTARLPLEVAEGRKRVDAAAQHLERGAYAEVALQLAGEPPTPPSVTSVRWLVNRGRALAELARVDPALATYDRAVREARALGWLRGEDHAWHGRFWTLRVARRYVDALAAVAERRRIAAAVQDERIRAYADHEQAALHIDLGEAWSAVPILERVIPWFDEHGPVRMAGESRALLALAEGRRGNYAPALTAAERAAELALEAGDAPRWFDALHTQSGILLDMGAYGRAIKLVDRLLAMEGIPATRRGQLLANRAMANAYLGVATQAREDFERAIALVGAPDEISWLRWFRMMRALTLHLGERAWAEAAADARAAIDPDAGIEETNGWARLALGTALLGARDVTAARVELERALRIAHELDILDLRMFLHGRLAEAALESKDAAESIRRSRQAVADLDLIAAGLADDEGVALRADIERARLFRTWRRAAALAKGEGRASALFEATELGRARLLLAAIGGSHRARGLDLPEELRERERMAQRQLLLSRERYQRARARRQSFERRAEARKQLEASRDRWLQTVALVQRRSGARASLAYPVVAKASRIQGVLRPDEAVVIHVLDGDAPLAIVITRTTHAVKPLQEWSKADQALHRFAARDTLEDAGRFESDLATLASSLLGGLGLPTSVRRLHVAPSRRLTCVPWPRLGELRKLSIHLIPSAATWLAIRAAKPVAGRARLLAGDPLYEREVGGRALPWSDGGAALPRLKYSADEVRGLERKGDELLLRARASETRVKALLDGKRAWDVVHLASHGIAYAHAPSLACLALSPSDQDDGFLTATEVFGLDVRARLVVLSACDVGRAAFAEGVGILGLVRAFMAAGAPHLVASLWPADDEATGVLMHEFHARRSKGASTHEALAAAQAHVRRYEDERGSRPWAAPYYWAGWVIWGEGR